MFRRLVLTAVVGLGSLIGGSAGIGAGTGHADAATGGAGGILIPSTGTVEQNFVQPTPAGDYTFSSYYAPDNTLTSVPKKTQGTLHSGIDISNGNQDCSTSLPVYAAASGTVIWADFDKSNGGRAFGWSVVINNGNSVGGTGNYTYTLYGHMGTYGTSAKKSTSCLTVSAGQTVNQGDLIGYQGSSGLTSPATHVHFTIMEGTQNYTNTLKNPYVPNTYPASPDYYTCYKVTQGDSSQSTSVTAKSDGCVTPGMMWVTGHDADLHCAYGGEQCHYFAVALSYVRNGSTLPVLALDEGSEVSTAVADAFGSSAPSVVTVSAPQFATTPLTGAGGVPLYSALVVASDYTCGGCDDNSTDTTALVNREPDIAAFQGAGGGILALAGADNSSYYSFMPTAPTSTAVTPNFTLTPLGSALGLTEGNDDNCCATHNSFVTPDATSPWQVVEVDAAGLPETMVTGTAIG